MLAPKEQLIAFLTAVREQQAINPTIEHVDYDFVIDGSLAFADKYVHRMRVALTRFRNRIKNRGRQIIPFRLRVRQMEVTGPNNSQTRIHLRYEITVSSEMQDDIAKIFEVVGTNHGTIDHKTARGLPPQPIVMPVEAPTISMPQLQTALRKFDVKPS